MTIDDFYKKVDKNNFYLGLISQVYRNYSIVQVENLSWLRSRISEQEIIIPNTINYIVIIDSIKGMFLGEIYQNKFPDTNSVHVALIREEKENVFPELAINLISFLPNGKSSFEPVGFNNVGLIDKVYIANNEVIKKYIDAIDLLSMSNNYDKKRKKLPPFATIENMTDTDLSIFPETLLDRHLMAIGSTNSGKSTTSLSILNSLLKINKKVLIIDPTGEYSNTFDNDINVKKYILGKNVYISTKNITSSQWATLFETNDSSQPAVLANAMKSLKYQYEKGRNEVYVKRGKMISDVEKEMASYDENNKEFNINLLSQQIIEEAVEMDKGMTKYCESSFQYNNKKWLVEKVEYKLTNTGLQNLFIKVNGKENLLDILKTFMEEEKTSIYLNASEISIGDSAGSMIIDLICNYIINQKKKDKIAFVVFIDEVHRYSKDISMNGYQTGLTAISREGRKKGIFLFLTTQNPQDVPKELLGQVGSLIVHRITHKEEIESIKNYLSEYSIKQVPKLRQGEAILTSINLLMDLQIMVNKSSRIHNNNTIQI